MNIKTKLDIEPPKISSIRIDNALLPENVDKVLTVVSWRTNELANSIAYFEEGIGFGEVLANKTGLEKEFTLEHTVILTLKIGTIYRIQISSTDEAGNETKSSARTILTPRVEESILNIIIQNFEEAFKFLRRK